MNSAARKMTTTRRDVIEACIAGALIATLIAAFI